jgi:hypothetical protein
MALANGTTTMYLPIAGSAGASLWGTDVRAMLTSPDGTADTSSTLTHGTGGDTRCTVDPYTASSTDAAQDAYGWAINPADVAAGMGSTSTLKRKMAAGNHVCTLRLSHSATLGDSTATLHFFAYRVGPSPGRTRTLLGSVDQAISLGALGAEATYNATIALGEVVFDNDETIQYSYEITATGQVVSGASTTFRTGTSGGVAVRVDFPELRTITEMVGSSAGVAAANGVTGKVLPVAGSSAGVATVAGVLGATKGTVASAAGVAVAAGVAAAVKGTVASAAGSAMASANMATVKGVVGTVDVGAGGGTVVRRKRIIIYDKA